jgi:YggT family protein
MSAILYILDSLLTLALCVVLARLLLQWARADFRNPLCQAVVRITNPLILPLRRILPPVGKVDTASVIAVIIVATIKLGILSWVAGPLFGDPLWWIRYVAVDIVSTALWIYFWAIFLYALLSMIAPGGYSPMQSVLASVCEPILRPFRRLIPAVAGLDLSPLWAGILIQALLRLIHY